MQPWCGRLPLGHSGWWVLVTEALGLGAPTPESTAKNFSHNQSASSLACLGAIGCHWIPLDTIGFWRPPHALLARHAPRLLSFFFRSLSPALDPSLRRVCSFLLFCKPYRVCSVPSSFTIIHMSSPSHSQTMSSFASYGGQSNQYTSQRPYATYRSTQIHTDTVTIPRSEYTGLLQDSQHFLKLRDSLLTGGLSQETLDVRTCAPIDMHLLTFPDIDLRGCSGGLAKW
ncbi:hypothetical protein BO94DRAFT_107534 [Aspergillus sclerotioniger CBS 115572]|uniref:Uncharacterized protein n=1 Tax=Aspergillus sclerotioniger CBS 115572 TaxID=1450535 RepID=A0A317WF42_9EURO|nr:hypothetical protein BO94DRAFT_107534 [Aspergillus sclerotioniger CBS 115572]PWY84625.1 hypothetical protein BO94DRAFT_107534 [Aspergillus sclerotioniger CBS 115572]